MTVPALGLAEPPTRGHCERDARAGHAFPYGMVTELVRRLLRGRPYEAQKRQISTIPPTISRQPDDAPQLRACSASERAEVSSATEQTS